MTTAPRIPALPDDLPLLKDEDGPVFQEPWQASAFAIVVQLAEDGAFAWKEWVACLSAEIKAAQERGDPDLGDTYYFHWLAALEKLAAEKGFVTLELLAQRKEEWSKAVAATPHGEPIDLARGQTPKNA